MVDLAIADTSFVIGVEQERLVGVQPAAALCVSVITVAELHLGVLAAPNHDARAQRMATIREVESLLALPIDREVAVAWSTLRMKLRDEGRRMPVNDSWIAATAIAHDLPVITQDDDYDGVPGVRVIRI